MSETTRYAVQTRNRKNPRYGQGTEFGDPDMALVQAKIAARDPRLAVRVVEIRRRVIWVKPTPSEDPQP